MTDDAREFIEKCLGLTPAAFECVNATPEMLESLREVAPEYPGVLIHWRESRVFVTTPEP